MSWLQKALNKVSEVGGQTLPPSISRTARSFAGSVYQTAGNAVVGGARLVKDRLAGRHLNNFKHAVRRLNEVALQARGEERRQALVRWLAALRDIDRDMKAGGALERRNSGSDSGKGDEAEDEEGLVSPHGSGTKVLFYDPEISLEPLSFRDVFLRSSALENIVVSLIMEAPQEEEVATVVEMFGLCLAGGPELHQALMSGIQDLAKANSGYVVEVSVKRQALLHLARECVGGLKLSSEVERLDMENARFQRRIADRKSTTVVVEEAAAAAAAAAGSGAGGGLGELSPAIKEGAASTEELLFLALALRSGQEKRVSLLEGRETEETHKAKVEKLKELTLKLQVENQEMESKVSESKQQKQDSVAYRSTKAQEVLEAEKLIAAEVIELEKKREKLEAELKEVKAAITAATARHIHIQEEKEQFDEASSNIIAHLSIQEEQLSHNMTARKVEIGVLTTWQSFLEDTWTLQTGAVETRRKEAIVALEEVGTHLLDTAASHMAYRQEEISLLFKRLSFCAEELENMGKKRSQMEELGMEAVLADMTSGRRRIEEKYLETEDQIKKFLSSVARVKEEVSSFLESAKENPNVSKLQVCFSAIEELRAAFEAAPRPKLAIEENPVPDPTLVAAAAMASGGSGGGAGYNLTRRRSLEMKTEMKNVAAKGKAAAGAAVAAAGVVLANIKATMQDAAAELREPHEDVAPSPGAAPKASAQELSAAAVNSKVVSGPKSPADKGAATGEKEAVEAEGDEDEDVDGEGEGWDLDGDEEDGEGEGDEGEEKSDR